MNAPSCFDLFSGGGHAASQSDDTGRHVTVKSQRQEITRSGEGFHAFHNSTALTGDALASAIRNAEHQDAAVLAIYRASSAPLSPSEVWHRCQAAGKHWPLTSVRRAISNLTHAGALTKLSTYRIGEFGAREHEWEAA